VETLLTRELKTRGHMMPPPLHVSKGLARPVNAECRMYCEICEVIRYVAAPVWRRFEFSVVSAPLSLVQFRPKYWWQWLPFFDYLYQAKITPKLPRDMQTVKTASAAHSLEAQKAIVD